MKNSPIFKKSKKDEERLKDKKSSKGGEASSIIEEDSTPIIRPDNAGIIYFYGRDDEYDFKLGFTRGGPKGASTRQRELNDEFRITNHTYNTVLALLWAMELDEKNLKNYPVWVNNNLFYLLDKGREEIVLATKETKAYLRYLRTRPFVTDKFTELNRLPMPTDSGWMPGPGNMIFPGRDRRYKTGYLRTVLTPWGDVTEFESTHEEFFTNANIIRLALATMGSIDIDPASCKEANKVVQATKFFTRYDLRQPWYGNLWINPPFGQWDIWSSHIRENLGWGEFEGRAIGNVQQMCIFVTASASTADQFQYGLARYMTAHCVCGGRRDSRCWGPGTSAKGAGEGNMVYYYGDRVEQFANEFSAMGTVWINDSRVEKMRKI
jgi:hypothetical protein